METESIKIGRISRAVEKALKVDFKEAIWVYVSKEGLDRFAKRWPESYLAKLEEASFILSHPDYVAFSQAKKTLYFVREYWAKDQFIKAALKATESGCWKAVDLFLLTNGKAKEIAGEATFRRLDK